MPTCATGSTTSAAARAATGRAGAPRAPPPDEPRAPPAPPVPRTNPARRPPSPPAGTVGRSQNPNEIPVGTEFDVRLQNPLSSKTAQVEDRFEATTMVDLLDDRGRVLVPSGSVMRGVISSVNKATRTDRKG